MVTARVPRDLFLGKCCAFAKGDPELIGLFSAMRIDELNDSRRYVSPKPCAVEHTIVANDRLDMMGPLPIRYVHTEVMRSPGLANARNIVLLAFDRHQRHFGDSRRLHQLAAVPVIVSGERLT